MKQQLLGHGGLQTSFIKLFVELQWSNEISKCTLVYFFMLRVFFEVICKKYLEFAELFRNLWFFFSRFLFYVTFIAECFFKFSVKNNSFKIEYHKL